MFTIHRKSPGHGIMYLNKYYYYYYYYKANDADIAHYHLNLDDHISIMYIDDQLLHCKYINCMRHKRDISMCYAQLIVVCSSASDSILTTSSRSHHSTP